ncbi:hypothetical protein HMI01_27890 [Halolactibacillus miurensis]|uniref:Beta-N-acetylglucosaminidase n=1 Tax=Halolactibacillus miurensis TaxID=306541 RepID=A0A1I6V2X2_9BACI|nr:SH3 domain-containing protein [Halolactibacillus miurensis]GEM05801.1 hypothetical protein HMI01_27890 [Halolactibacillus miurensis]SFT08059.1 Beta-N-acetylglucosaminidase [Halolactibacillus miurensis]
MRNFNIKNIILISFLTLSLFFQPINLLFSDNDLDTNAIYAQSLLKGISLIENTPVYSEKSLDSSILKNYAQGSILQYTESDNSWFSATVIIDGKSHTGYISKKHVETVDLTQQKLLKGFSKENSATIYSRATKNSYKLRTYSPGSMLLFKSFSNEWYEAHIIVDGKGQTGYIHHSDVELYDAENQQSLKGVALNDTNIYTKPAKSSSNLRTYDEGHILYYKTFSNNWYEAYIIINGTGKKGYIQKSDVETLDLSNQQSLRGFALNTAHVYDKASEKSVILRSYSEGHLLYYKTFSTSWYEAYVIINGKGRKGYIPKNSVDNIEDRPVESLRGLATKNRVNIYSRASNKSPSLKSYPEGHILYYKTLTTNWYEATVYVNGQKKKGYIYSGDVETLSSIQNDLNGYADQTKVNIYSKATRNSNILRSYPEGHYLYFKSFSSEWYQAFVYLNGAKTIGYINKGDIDFQPIKKISYSKYDYTFDEMINIQMGRRPQANGTGTINAVRSLVEYYANPSNFRDGEDGFFQFLDLASPAGLNPIEVNDNILNSKTGTLAGTASAFIEAGNRYGINEAYLIAHALHETGNGASQLAQGIEVNGRTVYNMYGTAAYDGTANSSGAQYAYEKNWFTPEAAIIGGAEFVAKNYIHKGQDTLYKMRWNPDNPGVHQYATHVAWAQIPTARIQRIYNTLSSYVLIYDVPKFINQPGYQGSTPPKNNSSYPVGAIGVTTGTNVRFRSEPSTVSNNTIIATIANIGTELIILSTNNQGWYEAKLNGHTGWVTEDYIKLKNVAQVTASGLNVRENPTTSSKVVGSLSNGSLVTMVLKEDDSPVTLNEWYKINYNNSEYWISSGTNHSYLKIQ